LGARKGSPGADVQSPTSNSGDQQQSVFSTSDTIVAIATPPGRGGIGIVRLSGPQAEAIARRIVAHDGGFEPRRATFACAVRRATEGRRTACGPAMGAGVDLDADARPEGAGAGNRPEPIDEVLVTYFPGPASYTGEDVVEVSAHGSPVVLQAILQSAVDEGARPAEPGEFTLRRFLHGRIDLMQAEAIADLVDAVTPLQARAAFDQLQGTLTRTIGEVDAALFDLIARLEASVDFPEEGYHFVESRAVATEIGSLMARLSSLLSEARRGRMVREGLQITIAGKSNVGKSSVFNALAGTARTIVTPVPGTTRDLVSEVVDLDGLRVTLVDTAGVRPTTDPVEIEGVERARQAMSVSDLTLVVVDASGPLDDSDRELISQVPDNKRLVVFNKIDVPGSCGRGACGRPERCAEVSALRGDGLEGLRERIVSALDIEPLRDRPAITNVRHVALVEQAHAALARAVNAATGEGRSLPEEFVLADLQDARAALEEVAGRRMPEDLLEHIFSRFCVGK
jgi:tRNA modification GTPase